MNANPSPLPLVVQLGFAGSRHLLDREANPDVDEAAFLVDLEDHLKRRLESLRRSGGDLGLQPHHFLCGISQIAIGADTLFTRACSALGIPQRILLPEDKDEYLNAVNSGGAPDFSESERKEALRLLASPHIIHERVVSDAPERHARFEDVNLEIVRISDVIVCMVRPESGDKPGGTHEVIARAATWQKPVLIMTVGVKNGRPDVREHWQSPIGQPARGPLPLQAPALPPELAAVTLPPPPSPGALPSSSAYVGALKSFASPLARRRKQFFRGAATIIIGSHVLATVGAVFALKLAGRGALPWVLGGELALLLFGFGVHQYLHRSEAARIWAVSRLVAELCRSVRDVGKLHVYLGYLFSLPFPDDFRPLLRTINVLHLRSTRTPDGEPWGKRRDTYVKARLADPASGQIPFYGRRSREARTYLGVANAAFLIASGAAILAVAIKILVYFESRLMPVSHGFADAWCGPAAIILPVMAVAALSLAAAFDWKAQYNTYAEMCEYLEEQKRRLDAAQSEREFARLVLETESRLLGENVNWFSRRSYTGVA